MLREIIAIQAKEAERKLAEPCITRDVEWPAGNDDLIRVVTGPRRAGKSFLALHRVNAAGRFGYVNFDDERLARLETFDKLESAIDQVCGFPEILLLDEIQNVPSWEMLVNRLQRQGRRLTITGSNAHMLSTELATHLTGRHLPVILFPFSFREFVRATRREPADSEMPELFKSYVECGGYPEPLLKDISRSDYLTTLFRSILYKDVVVRHRIRIPIAIEDTARLLVNACSQRFTSNSVGKALGGINPRTVQNYIKYLEEAFLIFTVRRFSYRYSEQARAPRKAYFIDTGMVTTNSMMFSRNLGALYENAVACVLRCREMAGSIQLFYWQGDGQEEVDFVIKRNQSVESLIQVCFDPSQPKVFAREARALVRAGHELKCENLMILTDNIDSETDFTWYNRTARIKLLPVWKWAMGV